MRACTVANHRDDLGKPFTCEVTKMEMSVKGKNADATCPDNAEMIQLPKKKKSRGGRKEKDTGRSNFLNIFYRTKTSSKRKIILTIIK